MAKIARYWFPPVLWAGIIFTFSSLTSVKTVDIYWQDFIVKKLAHVTEYAVLAVLVYRGLINSGIKKNEAFVWSVVISCFYGVSDEFHQSFTPGREPRIRDILFDTMGAVGGVYIVWKLLPKAPKKLTSWAKKLDLV